MSYIKSKYKETRDYLVKWQELCNQNFFTNNNNFKHSINYYIKSKTNLDKELTVFVDNLIEIEDLVKENHYRFNYPRLEKYNGIGNTLEQIVHHPNYEKIGNVIYGSKLLEKSSKPGGLQESLAFFFLSGHLGEAGHNCPFACSAGLIRVLQKVDNIPKSKEYIDKLCNPSYSHNFTGAQFITEIQGGSDVGQNATLAYQDKSGLWKISGEKWFCSNANADLILMTARYDTDIQGAKGLGLFLLSKFLDNNEHNSYKILRLKEKIGTNAMASGEIIFEEAIALPVGKLEDGFKLVMENVLHISRLCNSMCVLGMAHRAFTIAEYYAQYRTAFGQAIINYPLVQENLAIIKAENTAALAATMATIKLQDDYDTNSLTSIKYAEAGILLRLFANLCKYFTALYSVEHIHHAIDVLAGNGAIESFSILPRLLRDSIVCENWEGTHNTLRMQIARDMLKYDQDKKFIKYMLNKLNLIKIDIKLSKKLNDSILNLQKEMDKFRKSDIAIQALQIKNLVENMGIILCTICLFEEAENQILSNNEEYKLDLLYVFIFKHIDNKEIDINYINLLKKICINKD